MDPRIQRIQNDNAGQKNTLHNYDRLMMDFSPRVGGMNNWGRKSDPYGTELPAYLPKPPGNDTKPGPSNVLPFNRTSTDEPTAGLLAGGVPLPPRRPPGMGMNEADLPSRYPGPPTTPSQPSPDAAEQFFKRMLQRYPFGQGAAEDEPQPAPPGQSIIQGLNRALGGPAVESSEDVSDMPKQPMPPEYEPQRPIPLGEIQRRWGVPRLEDL